MSVAARRARRLPSVGVNALREAAVGYAFVLVPLFLFGLFQLYPMIYAF